MFDYFQNNNKEFSILHLNIRRLQKILTTLNFFLYLNFTFKVIYLPETCLYDAKHAAMC